MIHFNLRYFSLYLVALGLLILMVKPAHADVNELHSGQILEILEAGGYSYFYIEEGDSTYWIAVRETPAYIGARISFVGQMWMPDFQSSTLSMTFPNILFSGNARIENTTERLSTTTEISAHPKRLPEAISITDIYRNPKTLGGDTIMVFGEVTKVMHKVMGKTWIHLNDTGGAKDSSKIVITTMDNTIEAGAIVNVKGLLSVDRDFGYGYFYPIIIEDAVIIR